MADVVKMTDPQLNLVLAEGGGKPSKNRFDNKQTKDNPYFTLCKISNLSMHETKLVFKRH